MKEQRALFDPWERTWIGRTWQALGLEKRREVLRILAEMGRATIVGPPRAPRAVEAKGERHEP